MKQMTTTSFDEFKAFHERLLAEYSGLPNSYLHDVDITIVQAKLRSLRRIKYSFSKEVWEGLFEIYERCNRLVDENENLTKDSSDFL